MNATRRLILALLPVVSLTGAAPPVELLRFSVVEGSLFNEFFRQGPVAAHVVLRSGTNSRLVIAFPAGNSGLALWFDERAALEWQPIVKIEAAERLLPAGGMLRGVILEVVAKGGPVSVERAIVGSVRVIRDFEYSRTLPSEVETYRQLTGREVTWQRRRLDGASGYYLSVEALEGAVTSGMSESTVLSPGADGRMRLRVTALTGDTPLTPLEGEELVTAASGANDRLQQMLDFLCYEEKLLAGSWRFGTYFGRDTLMSLRLLASVLQPRLMETGLGAVLKRLNAEGEVAHEEDVGEYAVLRRKRAGLPMSDAPLFDYKMIDDDFMLAVVAAHYLLDTADGRARAAAFLARTAGAGEANGSALARNARFVLAEAAPFARDPQWRRLVSLKPGQNAGNWRDSDLGLGGGIFPYDVNGILVPAALDAIARLHGSGLLEPYLDPPGEDEMPAAAAMAAVWRREAPRLFDVQVATGAARSAVIAYADSIGIDPAPALSDMGTKPVKFRAVSLDDQGRPVPVLNSDEAFALLFGDITPAEAGRIAETLLRAFPAGLLTDAGLLVANPAFAPAPLQPAFDRNHYHGTVVWSWQQAVLRAGIDRQLARGELAESTRAALMRARAKLTHAIGAAQSMRGSELWSWSQTDGEYAVEPFGQSRGHETESNAAQLWSTVHLAWPPD
ncbi:MAG TPA: hypothetical protein VGA24_04710 [Steroidobacteraceae bacterium]